MDKEQLKHIMAKQGWTVAHLANMLDANQRTVLRWLEGKFPVPKAVKLWLEELNKMPISLEPSNSISMKNEERDFIMDDSRSEERRVGKEC